MFLHVYGGQARLVGLPTQPRYDLQHTLLQKLGKCLMHVTHYGLQQVIFQRAL
jgi:hypothetical protein